MKSKMAKGFIGIDGALLYADIPFIGDVVGEIARSEFKKLSDRSKKSSVHDGRIPRIADVSSRKRKRKKQE